MQLRVRALGLAGAIVWGLYVFLATLWCAWFREGATIPLFAHLYPGYAPTFAGAVVGFAWGCVDGFFCGALVAWLYNRLLKALYSKEASGPHGA